MQEKGVSTLVSVNLIENDLDNEQQTLHFPILGTTAKGKVVMRR